MNSSALRYFLFPHMTLNQRDYRHLSLLVPQLTIMQVLRPPVSPEWGADQFSGWPTITELEHAEQVKLYLKGFQDFADLHGEDSVLASMTHNRMEKEVRESRFIIQEELRGKSAPAPESKEKLFIEAAVFMEMARELDEKQMDLAVGFRRVESLEEDFREILGITDEKDFEEAVETLAPPLTPDEAHLSFMLRKRIAYWLRMYHNRPAEEAPVLVARSNEVLEELMDPIKTEYERTGTPLEMKRVRLASIPSLEHLDSETFEAFRRELHTSKIIDAYWSSLEDVLRVPHNPSLLEKLEAKAAELAEHLESRCGTAGSAPRGMVYLTLLSIGDFPYSDLWRWIDKTGHNEWKSGAQIHPPRPVLLSLSQEAVP